MESQPNKMSSSTVCREHRCHDPECSSSTCVHKQTLASHIVDLTFDAHKTLLRKKLKDAQDELEKWRSGDVVSKKDQEIAVLKEMLLGERQRVSQLQSEVCQLKMDQLVAAQQARRQLSSCNDEQEARTRRAMRAEYDAKLAHLMVIMQSSIRALESLFCVREEWDDAHMSCLKDAGILTSRAAATRSLPDVPEVDRRYDANVNTKLRHKPHLPPQRLASSSSSHAFVPVVSLASQR